MAGAPPPAAQLTCDCFCLLTSDAAGHLQWRQALPAAVRPGRGQAEALLRGVRRRAGAGVRRRGGHAHHGRARGGQRGSEGDAQLDLGMHPQEAPGSSLLSRHTLDLTFH